LASKPGTLSQFERLPDDLLLNVLGYAMVRWRGWKTRGGSVRGVNRKWRALHDGACTCVSVLRTA